MAWVKLYERIGWENVPSTKSPINDLNLNKIDIAVDGLDDRVIELQTTKAEQADFNESVKDVDINQTTGVITITFNNNTTKTFDTVLEKVVTNFRYDATTQSLILTLADGTTQSIPLSEFTTQNEFLNSDRITFSVSEGKVRADLIKGSITGDYLQPNYLADITAQASLAGASAAAAATSEANAAQSAQTASTKATEASQSATTASTKADEASASATTASTKATEATTAAQTATTKASEASTSAQIATTKSTEAATSASNASTSETNAQNSVAAAHVAAVEASASADRAEQAAQSTEGVVKWSDADGYVGANLLDSKRYEGNVTKNGLTYRVNSDGSVTVNGTATAQTTYSLRASTDRITGLTGDFYISGCTGGTETTYFIYSQIHNAAGDIKERHYQYGDDGIEVGDRGLYKPLQNLKSDDSIYINISVRNGVTMNNVTFYPMLSRIVLPYKPYLPKNDEIAKRVEVLEKENLLPNPLFSFVNNGTPVQSNGIIAEQKADGSIVINGTATVDVTLYVVSSVSPSSVTTDSEPRNHKFRLKENGIYTFTGAEGGSSTTYQLIINRQVVDRNYQAINYGIDYGNGVIFNQTDNDGDIAVAIRIFAGYVCDNLTFKPMIVKGTNKQEYVPYKWDYTPTMLKRRLAYTIGGNALYETSIADIEIPEDLLVVGFASINTANGLIVRVKDEVVWGRRVLFAMKNTSSNKVSAEMVIILNCIPRRPWEY